MKCSNCGNEFEIGIFCPKCGFKNDESNNVVQDSTTTESVHQQIETGSNGQAADVNTLDNSKGKGLAIASLVMGIISIITMGALIIPEILGIVFAFLSKKDVGMRGTAKAGLVCSIISIVIFLIIVMFL